MIDLEKYSFKEEIISHGPFEKVADDIWKCTITEDHYFTIDQIRKIKQDKQNLIDALNIDEDVAPLIQAANQDLSILPDVPDAPVGF